MDIFRQMGDRIVMKDPQRAQKVFQEYFLDTVGQLLQKATIFEKKEQIIKILYYFIPWTVDAKHQMIALFKSTVKNQNLFMQALAVLLTFEDKCDVETEGLLENFLFYAKTGMQSAHPIVKTMALNILANIAKLNYNIVYDFVASKLDTLATEDWWENKAQVIILCSRIIKGIIASDNYQNLVKKVNPQYTKNYSLENEMLGNKLKNDVDMFSEVIMRVTQSKSNHHVFRTFIVHCVEIAPESKLIMEQIVHILIRSDDEFRNWFYHNTDDTKEEFVIYNDKSLRYKTSFDSEVLKKSARDMLLALTEIVQRENPENFDYSYLEIIEFGLLYTDFKVLNIEAL